jgi:hypothetical protein
MTPGRPPAWAVLEQALRHKHPVHMRYRGKERLVCPHALGWKDGRAKALVYQTGGTTGEGELPADPRQRWRSLFVDEVEQATISMGAWGTAENYTPISNGIAQLDLYVDPDP